MKKLLAALLALVMVLGLVACGGEKTPATEAPVEEAPAEEATEAPVEEAPVEEAPVEEAPVEEAPVEEAPVEEAPADAPASLAEVEAYGTDATTGITTWEYAPEGYASEGPMNLFDFDETTKWCHGSSWSYVVFEVPEAVSLTGYTFVTANDNASYPDRNPYIWTLFGCNEEDLNLSDFYSSAWNEIDVVDGDTTLQDVNYTPFDFMLKEAAPAYKFYMLEINELYNGSSTMQLSGLNLIYEGAAAQAVKTEEEIIAEKEAAAKAALIEQGYVPCVTANKIEGITALEGDAGFDNEGFENMFDYDTATKWCIGQSALYCTWQMPAPIAITGYQLVTANDTEGNPGRNPATWTLSGSTDGSNWTVIDAKTGDATLMAANYTGFDFWLDAAAPEYTYFKFEVAELQDGSTFQLSGLNLLADGNYTPAE